MSVEQLLHGLRERGILLSVDGQRLLSRGPKGALTEEQREEIARRKNEIILFLRQAEYRALPPIPKADRDQPVLLSFPQERMWFLHRFQPESSTYNIAAFTRFDGPVDTGLLEASVREVVRRHECLRTSFPEEQGAPSAVLHRELEFAIPVSDLSGVPPEDRESRLREFLSGEVRPPFDLARAPLFRIRLVRLAEQSHVLLVVLHHIICDAWSVGILLRETADFYRASRAGQRPNLPALPLQYADYASWQRKEATGEALARGLQYWKQKLEGAPRLLELPTDFRRRAVQSSEGAIQHFELPEAVSVALRRLGQQERSSPFMVLLAVFKALLYRYTHQKDIVVGTPVQTRERPELELLIGCFVNTLVLRTQLSGESTARQLLHSVRDTVLEAHDHLSLPFEKLVEALRPERTLAHSALFQVAFQLQNTPLTSEYETLSASSMFDLSAYLWESGRRFRGAFEYSTDLFKQSTIERMARHFGALAAAFAEDADRPLGSLSLLSAEERIQVLGFTDRAAVYPKESTVHELFSRQAERTPAAPAAKAQVGRREVSYAELESRSNRLAHRLRALGAGVETLVGICMDRSVDMITALLAVLKAGGAYVPLEPRLPRERLDFMMEDTGLRLVLTEERLRGLVAGPGRVLLSVDHELTEASPADSEPPANLASPENLAYVIYTSGSTGRPKGVQVTHRAVVNFLESMRREPGLNGEDRLLAVTPLSFDIAGLEIFLPLLTGAQLLLASRNSASDGMALRRLLDSYDPTLMQATPATWRMLLEAGWRGRPGKAFKVLCGGEALPRELANELLATGSELWNLYGPTETTIWSAVHRVTEGEDAVPIGKPIANTQLLVLDENRELVPPGVRGELYIGGDGLARGYLNRPELTAEKFIPHPFLPGQRLYRTGDLAQSLPDGTLQFVGRADHQVKIRGLRIELEEIEHAVRGHPDVQEAIAAVAGDSSGSQALVCYLLPRNQVHPVALIGQLRRYLAERLPEYMVPATFTMLKSIPLTPNGKVDRKALPAPTIMVEEPTPPRSFTETQLLTIWQQVLGVQGIGTRDNFFELGGHSLLAVTLFSHLEKLFGPLPVALLFQAPTVEQMAAKLADSGVALAWRSLVAIQARGERPPLFLVPGVRGHVLSCTNLALGLGADQPVYGLHYVGVDGRERPLARVEDMAAHFISEIRTVQKSGPYYLAGHCVGGAVAFEMARQLTEQGLEVGRVFMIDVWPPRLYRPGRLQSAPLLRPLVCTARCAAWRLRDLSRLNRAELMAYARRVFRAIPEILRGDLGQFPAEVRSDIMLVANNRALGQYKPKPYQGPVALIVPDPGGSADSDPRLEWTAFAGPNCELRRIPAPHHRNLMDPPWVGLIAEQIKQTLDRATAAAAR